MTFDFDSMTKKFEGFTGKKWNDGGNNDTQFIKKHFPCVSLEGGNVLNADKMHEVRDWCQEQFGDCWIYDWNDFYFHNQRDADWFSLRWLS